MPGTQNPVKKALKRIPCLLRAKRWLARLKGPKRNREIRFTNSGKYWEERYASGGTSGAGSYSKFAEFKADVINGFIKENSVNSVIEFGCGDGNQLILADYPKYLGFDVSPTAISNCRRIFRSDHSKSFRLLDTFDNEKAELTLSLDVVFHLVEDEVFENYMGLLFRSSCRYVIIYSSNTDSIPFLEGEHVRHRKFSDWIEGNETGWVLRAHIPNRYPYGGDDSTGSYSEFFIYEKLSDGL